MSKRFDVNIVSIKEVHELPHAWTATQYEQLLHALDFYDTDGLTEDDLAEMTIMALQDMEEPEDAADKVLALALGDTASKGVRQQLLHELQEERAWEEHGDMTRHAQIFVAAGLLNRAFPDVYPTPDIARLTLNIVPRDSSARGLLTDPPTPAFIARLLAGGMDDHSALNRLFEDQIAGEQFPEAKSIVWRIETDLPHDNGDHSGSAIVAYVPWHWIAPLKSVKHFTAAAHSDLAEELVLA